MVVDAASWVAGLPHGIEAVFFPAGTEELERGDKPEAEQAARRMHAQLLSTYVDEFARQGTAPPPLLRLDLTATERPFSEA